MVTDPPYGVEYDPAWRNRGRRSAPPARTGKVANDDRADWREAWALFPGEVAYVWHGALHARDGGREPGGLRLRASAPRSSGPRTASCSAAATTTGSTSPAGTRCARAAGPLAAATASRRRSGRSRSRGQDAATVHGTQKPVECMRRPIENNSSPGQAVYEPFCGSGTTIIAAEMTGRACHADRARPGLRRCGGPALAGLHRRARLARRRGPGVRRRRRRAARAGGGVILPHAAAVSARPGTPCRSPWRPPCSARPGAPAPAPRPRRPSS